jgi:hypothetical protein
MTYVLVEKLAPSSSLAGSSVTVLSPSVDLEAFPSSDSTAWEADVLLVSFALEASPSVDLEAVPSLDPTA